MTCHTSASSTASMIRAPSKDRFSIKICWPLIASVDLWEMEQSPLTLLLIKEKVRPHFGFHVIRGQTSTSCPLKTCNIGSATWKPACKEKKCREFIAIWTVDYSFSNWHLGSQDKSTKRHKRMGKIHLLEILKSIWWRWKPFE